MLLPFEVYTCRLGGAAQRSSGERSEIASRTRFLSCKGGGRRFGMGGGAKPQRVWGTGVPRGIHGRYPESSRSWRIF